MQITKPGREIPDHEFVCSHCTGTFTCGAEEMTYATYGGYMVRCPTKACMAWLLTRDGAGYEIGKRPLPKKTKPVNPPPWPSPQQRSRLSPSFRPGFYIAACVIASVLFAAITYRVFF